MQEEEVAAEFPAADGEIRFAFRGNAAEYFRIWIVNVALTLLTLGVFSAWAKVRTLRYFYANTFLGGANFEYHARPLSILVARIFVFIVVIGGGYATENYLISSLAYTLLLALFLPWAMVRGLSFNARNSSYRNIRFSFRRDYGTPYLFYFLLAIGVGFFALPWMMRGWHSFKAERHQLGELRFVFCKPSIFPYIVALWLLPIMALLMILLLSLLYLKFPYVGEWEEHLNFAFITIFAAALILIFFYAQAILFLVFWCGIQTESGANFVCDFTAPRFAMILFTNFAATVLSLGLLHPWAKVRKTRFLATYIFMSAPPSALDEIFARRSAEEDALGEELDAAEGFDFDAGLV